LPWVQEARTAIDGRDLGILFALTSGSHYVPDFVTPPPTTPFPELEEELELGAGTPVERVRIELDKLVDAIDGQVPERVRLMAEDPAAWLPRLGEQVRGDRKLAGEENWPRIRALLEGDVLYRARQLALGG